MHQDEGHYAGKHPGNTMPDERVSEVLKPHISGERISCSAAHKAAEELGVSPSEIGRNLDLLEVRITGCQLGLFGHGGKDRGKADFKLPAGAEKITAEIKRVAGDSGISCLELWRVAGENGCTKLEAAAICEESGIKIGSCQLGAF